MRVIFLVSSLEAVRAIASAGVLEINQTCAVDTGCFPGDNADFPVTNENTGSYQLTSSLVVPDQNTDAIQVLDDNVSIDPNDFAIMGPVTCSSFPLSCTPSSGTGTGVEAFFPITGTNIHNGSIVGMGASGVVLGLESEVRDLRVRWNRIDGVAVNNGSIVAGNTSRGNGNRGIETGAAAIVSDNTSIGNGGIGIYVGIGSLVRDNTARINNDDGIFALTDSTVSNNTTTGNDGDGITVGLSGAALENVSIDNTDVGLRLGSSVSYSQNSIRGNTNGTVVGGVATGTNLCNGNMTCP